MGHQRRIQVVASHVKKKTSPGGVEKASPTIGGADDQKIIPKKSLPCIYLLGSCIMDIQVRKIGIVFNSLCHSPTLPVRHIRRIVCSHLLLC